MRKNTFSILFAVILTFTLGYIACGSEDPVEHTDPAFLVGTWTNPTASFGFVTFTIEEDLTFECNLDVPLETAPNSETAKGRLTGRLDYSAKKLGPNDYILADLTIVDSEEDDEWHEGNTALKGPPDRLTLSGIYNLLCTLTPNADMTTFAFTTSNPFAAAFFDGTFIKETTPDP